MPREEIRDGLGEPALTTLRLSMAFNPEKTPLAVPDRARLPLQPRDLAVDAKYHETSPL